MSFKNFIIHVWKDSVWSKVIATIIMPYILLALGAIKSIFTDDKYWAVLCNMLNYGIPSWIVILVLWLIAWGVYVYLIYKKKQNIRQKQEVIRYNSPFITFKNESTKQRYCANCWENEHKKVQLSADVYDCFECPCCHTVGNFEELAERHRTDPFASIYKF